MKMTLLGLAVTGTAPPPRLWRSAGSGRLAFRFAHARGANSMHQTRHDAELLSARRGDNGAAASARLERCGEGADPGRERRSGSEHFRVARRNGVSRGLLNVWRRKARLAIFCGRRSNKRASSTLSFSASECVPTRRRKRSISRNRLAFWATEFDVFELRRIGASRCEICFHSLDGGVL